MEPSDWRELYAANRAVIEGSGGAGAGGKLALPKGLPKDLRDMLALQHAAAPDQAAHPGGSGEWARGPRGATDRPYFVYTPPNLDRERPAPLLVMLHGCTQDPASLASGTRMHEVADRHGCVVVYPQQTAKDNPSRCWNWFLGSHHHRGAGEPADIAAITREVVTGSGWRIDPHQVFVAGMSAGAAMAAIVSVTYPDLYAAVGIHSGLPCHAATSEQAAFAAMRQGGPDPDTLARKALASMGTRQRPVRAIVFHGTQDQVVNPVNGDQVVQQWLALNQLVSGGGHSGDFHVPSRVGAGHTDGGYGWTLQRWEDGGGRALVEYWKVNGLGHAWSGGAPGGSYTDPQGPSASDALYAFFRDPATGGRTDPG